LKKSIYSLHDLRQLAVAANRRYLAFLSSLDDPAVASARRSTTRGGPTGLQLLL
jgi:hypothetical protein